MRTHFTTKDPSEWLGETANIRFEDFLNHWKQSKVWSTETKFETLNLIVIDFFYYIKSDEEADTKEPFYYLASLPLGKYFTNLSEEILVPPHAKEQAKTGNLWIGNAGQITPVHYDYSTGDPGMDGIHGSNHKVDF